MWRILWHTVYLTSKSWGRDESIWVSEGISIPVSHTPHHHLCFMLHYRPLYLKYFHVESPERQSLSSSVCTYPILSLLYYFNNCQPNFFSRLHHCVSVPFHLHALFPNCRRENVEKNGGKKEGDHILASSGWYVALSFWILLSTLDRQLNKKTHRLPMCLHGSWFSWKQWEGWNVERAKPRSGVWGWVHHIYTGPQARRGKWLYCSHKVPPSISTRHLSLTLCFSWF